MPDTELPKDAKQLRLMAQGVGVVGWEKMGRKALAKAIKAKQSKNGKTSKADDTEAPKVEAKTERPKKSKANNKVKAPKKVKRGETKADKGEAVTPSQKAKAEKTTAKAKTNGKATKTTATKTVTKKANTAKTSTATKDGDGITLPSGATPYEPTGENPFRRSSHLFLVANLLLKGGKRRKLAEQLSKRVELHPYKNGETSLLDFDKRLLLGAQTMRDQHGYGIQRLGRGLEGTIKVFVPGSADDPRNSGNGKAKVAKSKKPAKVG